MVKIVITALKRTSSSWFYESYLTSAHGFTLLRHNELMALPVLFIFARKVFFWTAKVKVSWKKLKKMIKIDDQMRKKKVIYIRFLCKIRDSSFEDGCLPPHQSFLQSNSFKTKSQSSFIKKEPFFLYFFNITMASTLKCSNIYKLL